MGDWVKGYTLDLTETGDSAYSAIANKMDPEITTIYEHLNNLKETFYGATAPSDPSNGQLWYDSNENARKRYVGGHWIREDEWTNETATIAYVDATSFTVDGDKTSTYQTRRAVWATVTAGEVYSTVSSASYDSGTGKTTVTLDDSVLDSGLSAVYYGLDVNAAPKQTEYSEGDNISISSSQISAIIPLGGKTGGDLKVEAAGSVVKIEPGYIEIGGKWYYWDSELSFTIGPSGSNSSSDAVPTSAQMVYLYVDASELPSSQNTELTAANFISKNTAPAYNAAKHGWYDGDDRYIGAVYHDGTNLVEQEKHGNCQYFNNVTVRSGSCTSGTTYSVTCNCVPTSAVRAIRGAVDAYYGHSTARFLKIFITGKSSHEIRSYVGAGDNTPIYNAGMFVVWQTTNTLSLKMITETGESVNATTLYVNGFEYAEGI